MKKKYETGNASRPVTQLLFAPGYYRLLVTLCLLFVYLLTIQPLTVYAGTTPTAGDIIFNEFAGDNNANSNDFFELLVLTDNLDLRGLRVSDNEVTGTTLNNGEAVFVFGNDAFLNDVPKGTLIVVWSTSTGITTDTTTNPAGGDWELVLAPGTGVTVSTDGLGGSTNTGLSTSGEVLYLYLTGADGNSAGTDNIYLDYISSEGGGNPPTGFATVNLTAEADNAYYTGNTAADNDTVTNWVKSSALGSETPGDPNPTQDLSGLRVATDNAPKVSSTTPLHNATAVALNSTITLNFDEAVDLTANAVTVECPVGAPVAVTGLPANDVTTVTLTPSSALPAAVLCTVTAVAAEIIDNDGTVHQLDGDGNGTGGDNFVFSFTTVAGATPTIVESATTTFLALSDVGPGAVSGVIGDPTDPAATLGIDFTIADSDTPVGDLTVTATSNNQAVVPNANLNLTGADASRNLKITSAAVGYATVTVIVSDGSSNASYVINYAASAAADTPATSRYHTGKSDASTAIAIDADYMLVADDEDQTIRVYDRDHSGLPVAQFDYTSSLGLTDLSGGVPREVDIESATRVGNRIYWQGSHSNSSSGNDRPNRERVFATDLSGTGAATTLTFVGFYQFLEDDLVAWDSSNGHTLGANFFGLAGSISGVPETTAGFNIEGLSMAPGSSTTAYVGFRAPIAPAAARTKALIVPVTNYDTLLGQPTGTATFGTPIQLNLGGRGIRSLECNANGCLILAGAADGSGNFKLYTWSGNAVDLPEERAATISGLAGQESFESIVELPAGNFLGANGDTLTVQFLRDNGDTIWYGDSTIAKDLPQANHKKFRSDLVALGVVTSDNGAPTVSTLEPADDAANVAGASNLVITFNEAVQLDSGLITLKQSSDDSTVESFDVATSGRLTVNGAAVTIDPTNDLAVGAGYYVEIAAGAVRDLAGNNFAGLSGNSAWNFTTVTPGQAFPLAEDFNACPPTPSGWTIVSVDADTANTWFCGGSGDKYVEANAFGDSAAGHEWLITPPLNMGTQIDEMLTFRNATSFSDSGQPYPQLSVLYSTDYSGSGNPTTATWTPLTGITFSPASSGSFVDSGTIDLSTISGTRVYFAFRYLSSGTASGSAARWRIDSVNFAVPPTATNAKIYEIQGNGAASSFDGQLVQTSGIVVADFQGSNQLNGFFLQDPTGDGDVTTSDGIFVFNNAIAVNVGDIIDITGEVDEFNTLTELKNVTNIIIQSSGNALPAPAQVTLPESTNGDLERYEGMYVQITDASDMVVAQTFFLGRYGQLTLSAGQRLYQPTNQFLPGSTDALNLATDNAKRLLILDDGQDVNSLGDNPNPVPYIGAPPPAVLRGGDQVSNLIGVLDFGRINSAPDPDTGHDYRLHPTTAPLFTAVNNRQTTPAAVGGTLKVAAFNVLNYFTTIDNGPDVCGPAANQDCRGADSASEFTRQRDKIVAALQAINADIVGLIELENNAAANPANDGVDPVLQDLVGALNAVVGANTYTFIDAGVIGTDAIKVALIYKSANVTPMGAFQLLTASVDPNFLDTKNRPALAQTFQQTSNGEKFTVVVNHLKSKGSDCNDVSDPIDPNGQGNCNLTRTNAATALASWLATDPTSSGDPDFLIIGDLNAYAQEDPITALKTAGYTDLINQFLGNSAYSFTFDGMLGYLDHALATASLTAQVTGVTEWHINTDEPPVIDYDQNFNPAGYYAATVFRSSDHDPAIVGLTLGAPEIDVRGNNVTIVDGATIPSAADHTDFGTVDIPAAPFVRTFTIKNTGAATLSGVSVAVNGNAAFTLVSPPAATVAANDSTTFQVAFDPSAAGPVTADVTIASNDSDENPYTFVIGGAGSVAQATITIVLDTRPNVSTNLGFSGDLGRFILDDANIDDGDAYTNNRTFTVAPGSYKVVRNSALNWLVQDIQCNPSASATLDLPNRQATLVVASGDHVTCTFIIERGVVITARVYNDLIRNGNNYGRRNAGDPWLLNWTITIFTAPGNAVVSGVTSVTTSPGLSEALFRYLRPGTYTACVTVPTGWTNSTPGIDPAYGQPCRTVLLEPGKGAVLLFGNFTSTVVASEATSADEVVTDEDQVIDLPIDPTEEESVVDDEAINNRRLFLPLINR